MFQLSRFRGIAVAGLVVLAAMAVVNGLLTAFVGPASQWLPYGQYPADRKVVNDTAERLSGAIRDLGHPTSSPVKGLGLLLGQSSLECAVDGAQLEREDGVELRWLNLSGLGGSMHRTEELSELVFLSGMVPEVAVLAVNLHFFVGTDYAMIRSTEMKKTGNRIKPLVWTWENRTNLNHVVQIGIYNARNRLLTDLGVPFHRLFSAKDNPWEYSMYSQVPHTDDQKRRQLDYDAEIQWFDHARYRVDSSNSLAFLRLCKQYRDAGSRVIVVILPMPGIFRDREPAEAKALVHTLCRTALPGEEIPVIDLEDQFDDSLFLDLHHLNRAGRTACTSKLAGMIGRATPTPIPPQPRGGLHDDPRR